MKILEVAWHIDNKALTKLNFSFTGGSLVINNLCEYIGRKEEVFLFLGISELPEIRIGNYTILQTDDVPISLIEEWRDELDDYRQVRLKSRAYKFDEILQKLQPNIVNFHDIGEMTQLLIPICEKYNVKYAVTNHLFIGKKPEFVGYEEWCKMEEIMYLGNPVNTITVSTGQKRKIVENYPNYPEDMIQPILNGTDYSSKKIVCDVRKKYGMTSVHKVLICSGTLVSRKNQEQIISAINLLDSDIKQKIRVILCGDGKNFKFLETLRNKLNLREQIIFAGSVEPEIMPSYYAASDAYIMPSWAEGLSISALEAMAFGKPIILFEDSECFEDLNDDKIIISAKERSDECFADSIMKWYEKEWDVEYIKSFSRNFTMEKMAQDYIDYYKNLTNVDL